MKIVQVVELCEMRGKPNKKLSWNFLIIEKQEIF